MNLTAGIIPVPVEQANPVVGPTEAELNASYAAAKAVSIRLCSVGFREALAAHVERLHYPSSTLISLFFFSFLADKNEQKGMTPKFILLTNPNNPLGVIYSREVMLTIVQWARKRRMHTIVDEIYALGVHKPPVRLRSLVFECTGMFALRSPMIRRNGN